MYNALKTRVKRMGRAHHAVSAKVAFLNETGDKVLMTLVPHGGFGLPGGHLDAGEAPDKALKREIFEELGLHEGDYSDITQRQFFRAGTRIILFYTGTLHSDVAITPDPKEIKGTVWVSLHDLDSGAIPEGTYTQYVRELLGGEA